MNHDPLFEHDPLTSNVADMEGRSLISGLLRGVSYEQSLDVATVRQHGMSSGLAAVRGES